MVQTGLRPAVFTFFFLLLSLLVFSQNPATTDSGNNTGIPFSFLLRNAAKTSAGVFAKDGALIRTLWSNEQSPAGINTALWDGKDDEGKYVADAGYEIKILSNNIRYTWEGVVGNTSVNSSGPSVHHPMQLITNMAFVGSTCYTAIGYNETGDLFYRFAVSAPNIVTKTLLKDGGQTVRFLATDGKLVYYAGTYQDGVTYFITGLIPGQPDALASFSSGKPLQDHHILYSAFDIVKTPITGMAVQTKGRYLFASHQSENLIRVFDKTTGALVQSVSVRSPRELAYDSIGNNLWVVSGTNGVTKYGVNADGTLSRPALSLQGLAEALDLAISPDGKKLAVIDRGTYHQVKFFNPATGALLSALGRTETYDDPDVYDDKFYFNNTRIFSESDYGAAHAFVEFQPDGSYWVGDYGNMRCQHFAADNRYLNNIQYMGYSYSSQTDINNPERVFSDFLEFKIDYAKPLQPGNGSWTFVRNWSKKVSVPTAYDEGRMHSVATLSNGRTYALYKDKTPTWEVIELVPESGIRHTGVHLDSPFADLYSDGSQWIAESNTVGQPTAWKRRPLTGFSGNNPVWGPASTVTATPPILLNDPVTAGGYANRDQYTSAGVLVTWSKDGPHNNPDPNVRGKGWHLGGLKNGRWLFKALPSTHVDYRGEFPKDAYEIGNGTLYPATFMQVVGRNIFCGQNCENWKGGQVNKYKHFWDNGLQLGDFGATILESRASGIEAYPGMAGNANSGTFVKVGNEIYFYHSDEGQHAGVHRWKISGLETIQEQTVSITKKGDPQPKPVDYIDLMAGLTPNTTLVNGTAGWTRSSARDYENSYADKLFIVTKRYTFRKTDMDVHFLFYPGSNGQTAWVKRDLGKNLGLANWEISGELAYPEAAEPDNNFFDVLDNNGKVIVRISRPESYPYTDIMANRTTIVRSDRLYYTMSALQPLRIAVSNGAITVSYAGYAPVRVSPFDATANWQNPQTLRVQFYSSGTRGHQIDVANLRFYKNTLVSLPVSFVALTALQKDNATQVKWTVEGGNAIDHYEVERSADGQHFSSVGSVASGVGKDYSWFDAQPLSGNNFYRIKSHEKSGGIQYSRVVNVNFTQPARQFYVFPNPIAGNSFTVRFENAPKAVYRIKLFSTDGQTLLQKDTTHAGGSAAQIFTLQKSLPAGVYNLLITADGLLYGSQLVVAPAQ